MITKVNFWEHVHSLKVCRFYNLFEEFKVLERSSLAKCRRRHVNAALFTAMLHFTVYKDSRTIIPGRRITI